MRGARPDSHKRPPRATRRIAYLIAATINLLLLWVANNLLEWGCPAILTDEFDDLVPLVSVSLTATVAVYLLWVWRDPVWFRHVAQIVLNGINLVVIVRTWQIFPFDFSGYSSLWETTARVLIGVGFVGTVIGILNEVAGLARHGRRPVGFDRPLRQSVSSAG